MSGVHNPFDLFHLHAHATAEGGRIVIVLRAKITAETGYYVFIPVDVGPVEEDAARALGADIDNGLRTLATILDDPQKAVELGVIESAGPV